jgi:hypothetical protein
MLNTIGDLRPLTVHNYYGCGGGGGWGGAPGGAGGCPCCAGVQLKMTEIQNKAMMIFFIIGDF